MNNKLNNIQIYLTFLIVVILILLSTGVKTSAANFKLNSSVSEQSLIPRGRFVPKFDQSPKKGMTNKVIPYDIQNDWNNCVWKLQDNGTLTISPKLNSDGQLGVASNGTYPTTVRGGPWNAINFKITKVVIEKGVKANSNSSYLFSDLNNVTEIIGLENLDTINVTNMSDMFRQCSNLTNLDLSKFDTSNVTNMSDMFLGCSNLTNLDLSKFDTSNVTNMSYMFLGSSNLANLDLNKFDTSNVTNMSDMFGNCSNLTKLDLSNFN
ncbi:MAG: BspA family leucine-rich repeat surface protein, partial [Lactobacillaceae bacterium]